VIAAVRYIRSSGSALLQGAQPPHAVQVFYSLAQAEVRTRLEQALRAGAPGLCASDLADLDAGRLREAVLRELFEADVLERAFGGTVDTTGLEPPKGRLEQHVEFLESIYRLSDAVSRAKAVDVIYAEALSALQRLLGADRAAVLLFDPDGVIRFKAWRGLSESYRAAVSGHSPWRPTEPDPQPIVVEDVTLEPTLENFRGVILGEGIRALGFIPLVHHSRLLGKFMVYYDAPHRFSDDEVQAARIVAHHIAFALERRRAEGETREINQQLLLAVARERQLADAAAAARAEAEAAGRRAAFLAEASAILAASLDYEATLTSVARLAVPTLADWCFVDLPEGDRSTRRLALACADPSKARLARELGEIRFQLDGPHPIARALQTGRSEMVAEVTDAWYAAVAQDAEHLRRIREQGSRSNMFVPLVARGHTLGVMTFTITDSGRRYGEADLALAGELACRAALAIDNARLYAAEQQARAAAQAAECRARLLAEASRRLAASLDYEATLRTIARLAVPDFADYCVVYLLEADEAVRRVALAHADPAKAPLMRKLQRMDPPDPDGPHPAMTALRTGRSQLVPEVSDSLLAAVARTPRHLTLLRRLAPRSMVSVPLVARARTLGALTLVAAESARRYGPDDVAFVEELARRAGVAVDHARLFREAQDAIRQALAATRARDAFLARASHELRTPLTAAVGTVRLLRRAVAGTLQEPSHALLEIANRNLDTMLALINDLLDASKLAASGEALRLEPVELARTVRETIETVGAEAREKGVAVESAVPEGLAVPADRIKLEQVFVNLLANAVKFTPAGGEVRVEAGAEGGAVVIRVRDTGRGIPPEHLEAIFEPFFRLQQRGAPQPRGTGLGLAICRQIVTLHGGRIWAESAGPGRGSTFTVRLSAAPAGERAA
jgi:signal transduction histidine kinase